MHVKVYGPMEAYDEKVAYLYRHQDGRCGISGLPLTNDQTWSLDHYHVHNKQHNRIKYPLLTDSLLNLRLVINAYNIGAVLPKMGTGIRKTWGDYKLWRAETFLKTHPKIAKWLNNPDHALFEVRKLEQIA